MITEGMYTPDAASAAPKAVPVTRVAIDSNGMMFIDVRLMSSAGSGFWIGTDFLIAWLVFEVLRDFGNRFLIVLDTRHGHDSMDYIKGRGRSSH